MAGLPASAKLLAGSLVIIIALGLFLAINRWLLPGAFAAIVTAYALGFLRIARRLFVKEV